VAYNIQALRATKGGRACWSCLAFCSMILRIIKLFSYTFISRQQFYFIVPYLKIIGHGNPDNNLESSCVSAYLKVWLIRADNSVSRRLGCHPVYRLRYSSGGQSPASRHGPGSTPGHIMWALRWRKWHYGVFSQSTSVSPPHSRSIINRHIISSL
jgi:hypothetical protein